jgi:hypothetical protein
MGESSFNCSKDQKQLHHETGANDGSERRIASGLAESIYRDGPGFSQLSRNAGTRCRDEKCRCGQFLFLQVEQY